jgi:hypothetical protein
MEGRLLGIHWRLRDFSLNPTAMNFEAFSRECWFGSFDLTGIATLEDDLAIGGKPISKADRGDFETCFSIARERHIAINWLIGLARTYSKVPTDT